MNDAIETIEATDTTRLVVSYVIAPLAVYGGWKLGSAAARKLRARRAAKKANLTVAE